MPYKQSRYLRVRVRAPSQFVKGSFRTQDIGRKGHSKRIAGRLKASGKWATQNFLINKKDVGTMRASKLLRTIKRVYPKATFHPRGAQ
jgi:hypothetical protein